MWLLEIQMFQMAVFNHVCNFCDMCVWRSTRIESEEKLAANLLQHGICIPGNSCQIDLASGNQKAESVKAQRKSSKS